MVAVEHGFQSESPFRIASACQASRSLESDLNGVLKPLGERLTIKLVTEHTLGGVAYFSGWGGGGHNCEAARGGEGGKKKSRISRSSTTP